MISLFEKYIDVSSVDTEERRRARLLNILLVGMGALGAVAIIPMSILVITKTGDWKTSLTTLISAVFFVISVVLIFWDNRRGHVTRASILFLVIMALTFTTANIEGLTSGSTFFYFVIPVLIASVLLRPYASFIVAGMIGAIFLIVGLALEAPSLYSAKPLGLFAIAVVSWLSARSLEHAIKEVRQINQELDQRVLDRTRELARANSQLEEQARELAEANGRLEKQAEELSEANTKLKSLDRLKSKFVADVTHELRLPISNLKIYVEMLQVGNPERRERYTAVLQEEITRLARLVEDILDITRMELGTKKMEFKWVNFNQLVEQVVVANRPRAETKGLTLLYELDRNLPELWGDSQQLTQVMTNLIGNAINYTPKGMVKVTTSFDALHHQAIAVVQDTGFGISGEDIPHLFGRFYRGIRASQSDIPGTGLGLAITKEILDCHQGHISVQSQEDVGSTFTVTLPIDAPQQSETLPKTNDADI